MKYTLLFFILSSFTLYLTSCEKAEPAQVYESEHAKHERLGIRADDCSGCDPADCCCLVTQTSNVFVPLTFCGTTNPDISATSCFIDLAFPCEDISGFSWNPSLPGQNDFEFFCVPQGGSFMIGAGVACNLRITCQYGATLPQTINLTPTAGQKYYFTVNELCELAECHLE